MKNQKLASRYAKSLLGLSVEQNNLDQTQKDAHAVLNLISENQDLKLLLKSPVVNADKKISILDQIFGENVGDLMMKFMNLIVKKGREALIPEIMEAFSSQFKKHRNIETAVITTAIPLDEKLRVAIKQLLEQNSEAEMVELEEKVDQDIIGGIVVRIGDKQVDESIKSKINALEQEFKKNPYIKAI